MAFIKLTPATFNVTLTRGYGQAFATAAIKDFANANVDFSAWTNLTARAQPVVPNPTSAEVTFGTVTGASTGIVTLATSDTDLATVQAGTCRVILTGKPTSGDVPQLIASGVLNVQ